MMQVFFSHAAEDKPVVEQVFSRVKDAFPDVKGWLDRYEIVGGDDLIDKLGIDQADKFLIFLGERSISKPWVKAELRKALLAEIAGVKPDFIVPVKLGNISKFPPFIELKYYIDLETKTEVEWLAEIYAAITGIPSAAGPAAEDNLRVTAERTVNEENALAVVSRRGIGRSRSHSPSRPPPLSSSANTSCFLLNAVARRATRFARRREAMQLRFPISGLPRATLRHANEVPTGNRPQRGAHARRTLGRRRRFTERDQLSRLTESVDVCGEYALAYEARLSSHSAASRALRSTLARARSGTYGGHRRPGGGDVRARRQHAGQGLRGVQQG